MSDSGFFDSLLATVLAPIVEACERSASSLPPGELSADEPLQDTQHQLSDDRPSGGTAPSAHMPPNADRMYLINCLLALWLPLSLHKACAARAAALRQRADVEVGCSSFHCMELVVFGCRSQSSEHVACAWH